MPPRNSNSGGETDSLRTQKSSEDSDMNSGEFLTDSMHSMDLQGKLCNPLDSLLLPLSVTNHLAVSLHVKKNHT